MAPGEQNHSNQLQIPFILSVASGFHPQGSNMAAVLMEYVYTKKNLKRLLGGINRNMSVVFYSFKNFFLGLA